MIACSRDARPVQLPPSGVVQPAPSSSQPPVRAPDRASPNAEACVEAARICGQYVIAGDAAQAVDCVPDSVVEAEGGRDAVIADLKQSLQELAQDGATVVRVEIEPPDRIVPTRDELYAILRQTVVVQVPAGEVFAASYLVGVAHRGTAAWKFVDGGSLSRAQVQQLLPNLPPELELPEVAKPRLVPTDRAVRE